MMMSQTLPKKMMPFIWYFVRPYKWAFFAFLIAPVALILEATIIPYGMKLIVDAITTYDGNKDDIYEALAPAFWLVGGSWIIMIIVFRLQEWGQCYVVPKFEADMRMGMFAYTKQHSQEYFANNFAGSISNKISDMVNSTRNLYFNLRWNIISTSSVIIAALVMLAGVSIKLSFLLGIWTFFHISIVYFFARKANAVSVINAEDRSLLSGKIVDAFTNISNIKLFPHGNYEESYLKTYQEKEKDSNKRMLLIMSNAKIVVEIPALLMTAAVIYMLVHGWQIGTVTSGDFVFVFYTTWNLIMYVWRLSMELPNIFKDIGIVKQALSIITPPHGIADVEDAKLLKVTKGEIIFKDVNFRYVENKNIFRGKNITIKAGEKVGLVGFSGSGKSTFVNLILRFYDIESGTILIDGQDCKKVTRESLRHNIAMIPQDTSLFHRTLMENIRYGRPDARDEEVIEASKKAYCHEFIMEMPNQYNTLVGERGIKLSGGQRQRIAVARAILKNAPILILDEATSSLDSLTEQYIQIGLDELMRNRTTIVIAHRLSTLSDMDRILVFKEGEIIEDGPHDELLAENGHYAKLWNMQVGGFIPERA